MNDIIIYSKIFEKHLNHLRQIFDLFRSKRVSLFLNKFYLKYSSIILLDQRVDSLEMFTVEEKIAAIIALKFLVSLKDLEIFLDLTDWLRSFILRYAQRVFSLQSRKTAMTRTLVISESVKDSTRKHDAVRLIMNTSIDEEIEIFQNLQKTFESFIFLMHFDKTRRLFVDLDSSKIWDFVVMIYHVLSDFKSDDFSRTSI